jgi:hypothetical protein
MPRGNGRKAQIREWAEVAELSYTEALRMFERADRSFVKFKAEWVKFSDYPVRMEFPGVLVSLTPDIQAFFDFDSMEEAEDGFYEAASEVANDYLHSELASRGLPLYDWTSNAAPHKTPETEDDRHLQSTRVWERVDLVFHRLFGRHTHEDFDAYDEKFVRLNDDVGVAFGDTDWDDIENRGAYEELARAIDTALHALERKVNPAANEQ